MTWTYTTWGKPPALKLFKVDDLVSVKEREGSWKVGSVHDIGGNVYYGLWSSTGMFCASMAKDCTEYIENKYTDPDWI